MREEIQKLKRDVAFPISSSHPVFSICCRIFMTLYLLSTAMSRNPAPVPELQRIFSKQLYNKEQWMILSNVISKDENVLQHTSML